MRTAPTRRELLLAGAAGALLVPASAAAAGSQSASDKPFSETDRLQRLIRLELLLLFCYRHILGSSILNPRAHRALASFPGHEQAHIDALARRLRARGGSVPTPPESITAANHDLAHRKIGGRLGQLRGNLDAIRLLLTLEQVTIGAYFVALTKLQNPELIVLVAEIMANDAQHDAMLGLQLPPYKPGSAAPYGLVQGLQ